MNKLDLDYQNLIRDILENGVIKNDRTGTGTRSVFGRQIRHKMSEGFPLLTTKKMAWKTMVTELLWFLRGDTNIKYLLDNDCHIWDGDAYKNYLYKVIRDKNIIRYLKSYSIDTHGVPTIEPYSKHEFIERIKNDEEFGKKWGDLGPIYGKQWRNWGSRNILNYDLQNVKWSDKDKVMELIKNGGDYSKYDVNINYKDNSVNQIQNLINELKTNPDSRRLMVNAWNVAELDQMVLPPCHYGFQVYTRELSLLERYELMKKLDNWTSVHYKESKTMEYMDENNIPKRAISLMWNQRSVDTPLGLPFNIASYGLLLEILAKQVNMIPDELIGNLGDCHIYLNQIDGVNEQLTREPYELPIVKVSDKIVNDISEYEIGDFIIENYQYHPTIKMPLSN